jgi:ribokinase
MIEDLKNAEFDKYSIVVMPDFFIDRIIRIKSIKTFLEEIPKKEKSGGGSIRDISIDDVRGGNAVNIAYCLAKLGVNVTLFTIADKIGSAVLNSIFSKFDNNKVKLKITDGKHGHTTAFEFFNEQGSKVNIMLNDVGDIANFGPEHIDNDDSLESLHNANAVIVVNWGSNLKGTQLIKYAFQNSPNALHIIDPADIESRKYQFRDALSVIGNNMDILSINENECNSLLATLGLDSYQLTDIEKYSQDIQSLRIKDSTIELSDKIGISTNIHTRIGSAWSDGRESVFVPSFKVEPKTLTGAGDAWNAAYILGHLIGLSKEKRLLFSNAYAALYVSNPFSEPSDLNQVIDFLKGNNI